MANWHVLCLTPIEKRLSCCWLTNKEVSKQEMTEWCQPNSYVNFSLLQIIQEMKAKKRCTLHLIIKQEYSAGNILFI